MQIIRKNFGLKLLAFALAVVGWAYFRFATNPIVAAARFDQQLAVPIVPVNLGVGYVAHFTEREAVVTISAKHGEPAMKPDEIKAVLDLGNKGVGVYNVPVTLVAPDVPVQSLSPASVTLSVERIEQRAFSVDLHYGTQSNGIVVGGVSVAPPAVVVQGPTSLLTQVSAVHVGIALPDRPGSLDAMVRPVAVNSMGNEVSGLVVSPDLVRVRAQFSTGSRTVSQ